MGLNLGISTPRELTVRHPVASADPAQAKVRRKQDLQMIMMSLSALKKVAFQAKEESQALR